MTISCGRWRGKFRHCIIRSKSTGIHSSLIKIARSMSHLKIRYRGRLRHPEEVEQLADEVEDICQSNGWESNRWAEDWSKLSSLKMHFEDGAIHAKGHAPLKGISFSPGPEMEVLWFTFTPDGILNSLFTLHDPEFTAHDKQYPWNRVKTKFGDTKTHAAICDLFRYLADKYCDDFEVMEETGYWLHRDMARLEQFMSQVAIESSLLEEELSALYADEGIDKDKKREIMYDLIRRFGERNRPYHHDAG